MSRNKAELAASTAAVLTKAAHPGPLRLDAAASPEGQSGSKAALDRLRESIADMKAAAIAPLLQRAVEALNRQDGKTGGEWALKALEHDEENGFGWYLLGIAREREGDFANSLKCYETALTLLPEHAEIANDLGRLAYRLDMKDVAAKLFAHFTNLHPEMPDGANNLACALRDLNDYDQAIDVLKLAISRNPEHAMLWNTLGSVLSDSGDLQNAMIFFDEALRFDPGFFKARYNRGNARMWLDDLEGALDDCETAMDQAILPDDRAMMQLARSTILLCLGRIGEGWDDYQVRLSPHYAGATLFLADAAPWSAREELAGKRILLMGEQGLGDEVLFANMVPDLIRDCGPGGKVHIAVEPRLVSLFARSFPDAVVGAHGTYRVGTDLMRGSTMSEDHDLDLWTPIGGPLVRYRRTLDDFPSDPAFLTPDPERVDYWRDLLKTSAPAGPKVGLLWKSMKLDGARLRQFSPFDQWAPVLATPGVTFVNLQYGDCAEEIALAKERYGVEIWSPPGIDLKNDLDDLAALSCALDLVIGFANATSNIAAASGARVWWISPPGAWTMLGTDHYPWYPAVRVFRPKAFRDWGPVMQEIAGELTGAFG